MSDELGKEGARLCCEPYCSANPIRWGRCRKHANELSTAEVERIRSLNRATQAAEYAQTKKGVVPQPRHFIWEGDEAELHRRCVAAKEKRAG